MKMGCGERVGVAGMKIGEICPKYAISVYVEPPGI